MATKLMYVADYEAVGRSMKPRRRHLLDNDCNHFYDEGTPEHTPKRTATEEEMLSVPPCQDCLKIEAEAAEQYAAATRKQALQEQSAARVAQYQEEMRSGKRARPSIP